MHTIYLDSRRPDEWRRDRLYNGQIFAFSARPATITFCDFARQMIEDAFGGKDPRIAQFEMPVEEFVGIFGPLKPRFIHDPESLRLIRNILGDLGCELEKTFIDVPRLRAVTSDGYLTSGVGYAHHLHRDTWYSAPQSQINWWMPIYELESEQSMAFHPRYWAEPVPNGSANFNYYQWNSEGRKNASKHIKSDTREQPKPLVAMEENPQIRVVCERAGVIMFSAAQMHSTVANTSGFTRFSIDFRTVNIDDVAQMRGAPNLDAACTGTSLRDFVRGSDGVQIPPELVQAYDTEIPDGGVLVYSQGAVA